MRPCDLILDRGCCLAQLYVQTVYERAKTYEDTNRDDGIGDGWMYVALRKFLPG